MTGMGNYNRRCNILGYCNIPHGACNSVPRNLTGYFSKNPEILASFYELLSNRPEFLSDFNLYGDQHKLLSLSKQQIDNRVL